MSSYVYYTVMKLTSIVASEKNIAVQNAVYTNGSDESMENSQKPPVGLTPRYIHDGERIDEILCAIERYTDANMSIPKSWVDELRDLLNANLK